MRRKNLDKRKVELVVIFSRKDEAIIFVSGLCKTHRENLDRMQAGVDERRDLCRAGHFKKNCFIIFKMSNFLVQTRFDDGCDAMGPGRTVF